jgi:predicted Zn-dependent protease
MVRLLGPILVIVLSGCMPAGRLFWSVRELVLVPASTIYLTAPDQRLVLSVEKQAMQKLFLAHRRITRAGGVEADLLIFEEEEPNAFAGSIKSRRSIAINTGMLKLIGGDNDALAALLGHETAHWAKGHVDTGKTRSNTIQGIGTLVGLGLGMAGVPAAGYISGIGADLIEASYSRDDEREADASGLEYVMSAGFDPAGALRLHEKLLQVGGRLRIPFLSTHPSGSERLEYLRNLIEAKKKSPTTPGATDDPM